MKKQVVVIHGGDTFDTYKEYLAFLKSYKLTLEKLQPNRWKDTLHKKLGRNFEVLSPKMPNSMNAKYREWKVFFRKVLPFVKNYSVLVGSSLGGIFLAKYLSENKFPKKILATFLIAAPYYDKDSNYSPGDFNLPKILKKFQKQGGKIYLYHSKDDPVVPFVDLNKYAVALPKAKTVVFKNRGHFSQSRFPELIRGIKKLYSK